MSLIDRIQNTESLKFIIVGISGVVVNYIVLSISIYILHLTREVSVAVAIFVSMSTNYYLNRIWTFKSDNPIFIEYIKYLLSASIGAIIQFVVTIQLDNIFQAKDLTTIDLVLIEIPTIYVSASIGIGIGFIANFILSKLFVFNKKTDANNQL